MEGVGEQQRLRGSVCEEEEQEQGEEASLLSPKHFIEDVGHGPGNSLLSTFHAVIVKDESESILETGGGADSLKEEEEDGNYCMVQVGGSPNLHPPTLDCQPGSILETRDGADPVKDEDVGGNYCMVHVSGSPTPHPPALDCQLNYATMCGSLPAFFGNMNSVPQVPRAEFTQEIPDQSQERTERYYPESIEKETKKQKISGSSGMCSPKTSSVAPGNSYSVAKLQDVNLNLGHATRRSARCAAASTAGRQFYKVSSFQEFGGSQDVAKEKKVPPENPEEQGALLPLRKKTRTFYSAEQLEELERMFQEDHYPDNEKRREIAAAVGVTPQRIMVWFQNRRAKWRKLEKLTVKGSKKCPASTTLSVPSGASTYGPSLLPMPPLPDIIHDQSAMLNMDTAIGNYPSMLSGHPAPLVSSSVSSVTGVVTCCEAGQTKALSQGSFGSSRMECFPTIPSPPPIRRASLPLNMTFNPNNHIVPLMLDTPNSECSPSSQESSSREVLTYSFQSQGISSPTSCNYPEQLEPTANLETPYYHYSNQPGTYQLPQYPLQHQLSQFHHLPVPLAGNVLPSVRLTPTTPSESNPAFFTLAGNSGVVTYGAAGASRGYLQHHIGGQILLQQPAGSSGGIAAYQAVPWNEFYMQGRPFSNQLCSRMQFSSTAAGHYSTEQVPYTQNPGMMQPTPCFLQLPKGATSGSVVFTEKQRALQAPDQTSYQNHQLQIAPAEREDPERSSSNSITKEEESAADDKEQNPD